MKIRQSIIQLESRIPLNPIRRQKSSRRTRDGVEISLGSWSVPAPSGTTVFTGKTNHTYERQISATPLAWRGGRGSEKSSEHATPPNRPEAHGPDPRREVLRGPRRTAWGPATDSAAHALPERGRGDPLQPQCSHPQNGHVDCVQLKGG